MSITSTPSDALIHDALKHWHTSIVESGNDFDRMKSTLTAMMPRLMQQPDIETAALAAAKTRQLKQNRRYKKLMRRCSQLNNALIKTSTSKPADMAGVQRAVRDIDIHEEAHSYSWRGEGGDYTLKSHETAMLEDFGHGLIGRIEETIRALSAEPVQVNTQGEWLWWGGNDEEFYTYGGYAFKEAVIEEALHDKSGEFQDENGVWKIELHICEARQDPLRFADWLDIDQIIDWAEGSLADSDRVSTEHDDGTQFDLNEAQKEDLEARIHEACDAWQVAHGLIFNTNTFSKIRNHEYLVLDHPDDHGPASKLETDQ